jgi:hypothetical protein
VSFAVVPYAPEYTELWDNWCADAGNSTFLHTRKFLGYHGDRFEDASALIYNSGRLVGVLPAARAPHAPTLVVSHPGATYGGIVHQGWLSGVRMIEAFEGLKTHYRQLGYTKLLYKPLPYVYTRVPSQDDLYALFRLGAQRVRCDLSCAIDLSVRRAPSERRRRGLKKALNSVTLASGSAMLAGLWNVLAGNLERKYDAKPIHSLDELALLIGRFSDNIQLRCAIMDGRVEAGVVLFTSANVWHAQYIASSEKGYAVSALDAVFAAAIDEARKSCARYFDFGTSNEDGGFVLNEGLYRFKSEFGGGGVAHEYYELVLS